jgi:hypothetical protein
MLSAPSFAPTALGEVINSKYQPPHTYSMAMVKMLEHSLTPTFPPPPTGYAASYGASAKSYQQTSYTQPSYSDQQTSYTQPSYSDQQAVSARVSGYSAHAPGYSRHSISYSAHAPSYAAMFGEEDEDDMMPSPPRYSPRYTPLSHSSSSYTQESSSYGLHHRASSRYGTAPTQHDAAAAVTGMRRFSKTSQE